MSTQVGFIHYIVPKNLMMLSRGWYHAHHPLVAWPSQASLKENVLKNNLKCLKLISKIGLGSIKNTFPEVILLFYLAE